VTAIDRRAAALGLARENARRHGVEDRIEWRLGDLLEGAAAASADLVVANLPYVPTGEIARLEGVVRDHEPVSALDGGPDGLGLIRRLIPQAARALAPGGALFLEVGERQGPDVSALLRAAGFEGVEIRRDLAGRERIARGVTWDRRGRRMTGRRLARRARPTHGGRISGSASSPSEPSTKPLSPPA
jgi:release factor glutamine methyltransferase